MKICPICQSTYDDSVDFCFKDGAPLDVSDVDMSEDAAAETLRADAVDDFEPPDAVSLSGIPSLANHGLPHASDEDLLPPEPTFKNLAAVDSPDDEDPSGLPEDPSGLPEDPSGLPEDPSGLPEDPSGLPEDPSGLPEDPSGLPEDPSGLPEDPSGLPPDSSALSESDTPTASQNLEDDEDVTIKDGMAAPVAPSDKSTTLSGTTSEKNLNKKKPRVEVTSAQASKPPRPSNSSLGGTPVLSARREAESSGNKGLFILVGLASLMCLGFIIWMAVGNANKGEEADGTTQAERAESLPPLNPPSMPVKEEAPGEDAGAAEDSTAQAEGGDETGAVDPETEGEEGAGSVDEAPEDAKVAATDRKKAESKPEPTPAPRREPTPAPSRDRTPTPRPKPAPSVAPEPPIAVVADTSPTPVAPAGSPWDTGGTPTPAPTPVPVDANNPWGTNTAATAEGTLIVSSQPAGATVLINGSSRGTTPLSLKLATKDYEIRVSKKGFASQSRVVKVAGQKPTTVDVVLESLAPVEAMSVIIASNPGGAIVFVDGSRKGPTPLTVSVPVGNHQITLKAANLPDCVRTLGVTTNTRNAFYDLNKCN